MKRQILLREYLRTSRRLKAHPSMEGMKKLHYLRFLGAHLCPSCEEDVALDAYQCVRDEEGKVSESYRCPTCASDYFFPQEVIH